MDSSTGDHGSMWPVRSVIEHVVADWLEARPGPLIFPVDNPSLIRSSLIEAGLVEPEEADEIGAY